MQIRSHDVTNDSDPADSTKGEHEQKRKRKKRHLRRRLSLMDLLQQRKKQKGRVKQLPPLQGGLEGSLTWLS